MIQQNKNEFDIASLPLPCLCPAFALPLPAGRRQAGGRQGVLFTKKQSVVNQS
jgi:hypothetical protein